MQILVVSDLHGDLDSAHRAAKFVQPDMILSCGDWGDPDQVDENLLAGLLRWRPFTRPSAITTRSICWRG